ncbi:MAG: M15 family metallopeptidase [Ruminococcus sp.]|nr:M15 family metallopeptidase [Ruminococcus sp.]
MRRKSMMKVTRGRLEEDRRKSEDRYEYQRVMLFILPLLMVAVLAVGVYFGYLSYTDNYVKKTSLETVASATESKFTPEENAYLLTVVNSANPMEENFEPELSEVDGLKVSSLMVDDLKRMLEDAGAYGLNLTALNGYSSFEEQKDIYTKAVKKYKKEHKCSMVKAEAAVKKTIPDAGESEQQTGLLIEFSDSTDSDFSKTDEFRWLMKNGVEYGFVLRYTEKENTGGMNYSPNFFRYVGSDNAFSMRALNMNLDEYVLYLGS